MALPTRIPPQTAPFLVKYEDGTSIVDTNWYLFLYNLWVNVLGTGGGEVPFPATVAIALTEIDVDAADIPHVYQQISNSMLIADDVGIEELKSEVCKLQNTIGQVDQTASLREAIQALAQRLDAIEQGTVI